MKYKLPTPLRMKLIREVLDDLAPTWLVLGFLAGIAGGVALAYLLD